MASLLLADWGVSSSIKKMEKKISLSPEKIYKDIYNPESLNGSTKPSQREANNS